MPAIIHKSPATLTPSGGLIDSFAIAQHLDREFPSPPLFPSGDASYAIFVAVGKFLARVELGFRPLIVPRVPEHLHPRGREYFIETRSAALGKPLAEVRPTDEEALARLWDVVEQETAPLIAMLKGRDGKTGPFFEGERPSYADLFLAAHLAFIERFDKELFGRFVELCSGEFGRLYDACLPWLEGQGEDIEVAGSGCGVDWNLFKIYT
ncbi:hypothetical protein N7470_007502 [Penicillium chermesinum]|nr:hypothetical protein N7470_007502 [Penicillium chermesinum]